MIPLVQAQARRGSLNNQLKQRPDEYECALRRKITSFK